MVDASRRATPPTRAGAAPLVRDATGGAGAAVTSGQAE